MEDLAELRDKCDENKAQVSYKKEFLPLKMTRKTGKHCKTKLNCALILYEARR